MNSPIAYFFVLPALVIFFVFTIAPTLYTAFISLFNWNPLNISQSKFIGLSNYKNAFAGQANPSFWDTAKTSAYFVVAMVVLGPLLALLIALLLQRGGRLMSAARTATFLPNVTPLVATSLVWMWIFNGQFGLANQVLKVFGIGGPNWLESNTWAMPVVIFVSLWHELGFIAIIILGGLTTMSSELSEAAKVDGCNVFQEFIHITLPQLRPVMFFVVVISTISSLQAFTQFYTMTQGNFGTSTLSYEIYYQAFVVYHTGYAAALAIVLLVITAVLSILQFVLNRTRD
ncbi:sugar ABC transporter permease [Flexivirga caeni]|uniref:Sugar ABC transporter permease n=2 Tax=Flexivirga caeni TaxID=2294115 RepID=A0A3M9M9Q0_9MICO|nr:sugar ABC transporter permease [Flexivirga caeni]